MFPARVKTIIHDLRGRIIQNCACEFAMSVPLPPKRPARAAQAARAVGARRACAHALGVHSAARTRARRTRHASRRASRAPPHPTGICLAPCHLYKACIFRCDTPCGNVHFGRYLIATLTVDRGPPFLPCGTYELSSYFGSTTHHCCKTS